MNTVVKQQVTVAVKKNRRPPVIAWILLGAALAMIPWLFMLAVDLPVTAQAAHWSMAWVGLDSLEAAGLATTGLLLMRRDARYPLFAAMTAILLLVDAWFDVTTASVGYDRMAAIVMALTAELPIAALLTVIAFRGQAALKTAAC